MTEDPSTAGLTTAGRVALLAAVVGIVLTGCAFGGDPPGCSEPDDSLASACVHEPAALATGTVSGTDVDFHRYLVPSELVRHVCVTDPASTSGDDVEVTFWFGDNPDGTGAVTDPSSLCAIEEETAFGTVDETYIWYAVRSVGGDPFEYTLGIEPTS
jgi:hypothetical protein